MQDPNSARTGVVAYTSARVGTDTFGSTRRSSTVLSPERIASANRGFKDSIIILSRSMAESGAIRLIIILHAFLVECEDRSLIYLLHGLKVSWC